ncbi:MAG: hypothetical protein CMJ89_03635 [Planctomycetes bacterium]|jgi:hypothetical protein|nr:hypothetical protein [Planctomycetota bacterium]
MADFACNDGFFAVSRIGRKYTLSNRDFSNNLRSSVGRFWLDGAMGLSGDASLHLLLDPKYWRPRLERLAKRPRQLVIFQRSDLGRPGIEVLELRLRAHDDERLTALLARSAFAQIGERVRMRACLDLSSEEMNWPAVESGQTDLVFRYPGAAGARRLEDRVLDVLRVIHAVCSIESVDSDRVTFSDGNPPRPGGRKGPAESPPARSNGRTPPLIDQADRRQKSLPDEFAIAQFFRSRGWI